MRNLLLLLALSITINLSAQTSAENLEWLKKHYKKIERRIPMRDGINLFTSILQPLDLPGEHPILLMRTPYSVAPYGEDKFSSIVYERHFIKYLKLGYIFVLQDVRGRYMSEGEFVDVRPFIVNKKSLKDTDFINDINWIAVLVAALGYFMLGAIWYSPIGFAKKWIRYTRIDATDPELKKGAGMIMLGSFIFMLVAAAGLAILINRIDLSGWMSGVKLGLLTGLCFAATAVHISFIYEKRPIGLHLIDGLYNVLGNVIAAVIICVWR